MFPIGNLSAFLMPELALVPEREQFRAMAVASG
jgi:hypothetical protein